MKQFILLILLSAVLISSCNSAVKNKQATASTDTLAQVKSIMPDTQRTEIEQGDQIAYHYQPDSSETEKANLFNGWIDTFTVDNRRFRLKYNQHNDAINIEYNEYGRWTKNTALTVMDELETGSDYNYDGYNDLYSQAQGWNYVNFYIPEKKLFSHQYQLPGDAEFILDSTKKIYANYREPYHICNWYISQLLDYKNTTPTIHYVLTGETYVVDGYCIIDSIKTLHLYKYNLARDTLILINSFKPKSPKKFEYAEFWENNYKRLMGYK